MNVGLSREAIHPPRERRFLSSLAKLSPLGVLGAWLVLLYYAFFMHEYIDVFLADYPMYSSSVTAVNWIVILPIAPAGVIVAIVGMIIPALCQEEAPHERIERLSRASIIWLFAIGVYGVVAFAVLENYIFRESLGPAWLLLVACEILVLFCATCFAALAEYAHTNMRQR